MRIEAPAPDTKASLDAAAPAPAPAPKAAPAKKSSPAQRKRAIKEADPGLAERIESGDIKLEDAEKELEGLRDGLIPSKKGT